MWKAYYAHHFSHLAVLLLRLFKEQFHVNYFVAFRLGYYSGKSAAIFRRTGDLAKTKRLLECYYQVLNRQAEESFDVSKAAELELEWWLVHRYPKRYEKSLAAVLAEAMAVLYGLPPARLEKYAEHRDKAMGFRDKATHVDKVEPDWRKIEAELMLSYTELKNAVNS